MWTHVFKLASICVPLVLATFERWDPETKRDPHLYRGKVLMAGEGKLVLTMGTEQLTFLVARDTKITLDGAPAKLESSTATPPR